MKDSAPVLPPIPSPVPIQDSMLDRWIHPAVILVATDLSDVDRLMPFALEQAAQTGARLVLLHVLGGTAAILTDAAGMPYYYPAGAMQYAARDLELFCEQAEKRGIPCNVLVREGNAAHQIGVAARQFRADRVLLGTRSRSRLGKLLLGSVAAQVLRSVNLPVLTVGPEAHLAVDTSKDVRTLLHATTLGETSRPSAALASQMAASLGAKLILLHVLPPTLPSMAPAPLPGLPLAALASLDGFRVPQAGSSGELADSDSAAFHRLRTLAEQLASESEALIEPRVVHGNPSVEILAEASGSRVDVIILSARRRSVLETLTRDRTIYRVLAHARCPVLTLRESSD